MLKPFGCNSASLAKTENLVSRTRHAGRTPPVGLAGAGRGAVQVESAADLDGPSACEQVGRRPERGAGSSLAVGASRRLFPRSGNRGGERGWWRWVDFPRSGNRLGWASSARRKCGGDGWRPLTSVPCPRIRDDRAEQSDGALPALGMWRARSGPPGPERKRSPEQPGPKGNARCKRARGFQNLVITPLPCQIACRGERAHSLQE